jgi:predicted phosphodiesterase
MDGLLMVESYYYPVMRVAAIYDIHGNLPALEAVLEDIRREGADRIVVGGDVFPGPMARESLERLMALEIPVDFIHGNGDRVVREGMTGAEPAQLPEPVREVVRTHMQFARMIGRTRVVNAGSVGMPFGEPGAYWLMLGAEVTLRQTPYDLAAAAQRIRDTRYPQAQDFAERNVLQPPS